MGKVEDVVSQALLVAGATVTASGLVVKIAQNVRRALDCLRDSKKTGRTK